MGTTTNGVICYGIQFDEDTEFPWNDKEYEGENYDGDIDRWWLYDVLGFKHSFEIYGDDGNYIDGKEPSTEDYLAYAAESPSLAYLMYGYGYQPILSIINFMSVDSYQNPTMIRRPKIRIP